MKRKVIMQGNNTLTVTLPRKWTNAFGINAGDDLDVDLKGKDLILRTQKELSVDQVEITINGMFLKRFIDVLYRKGHDEIKVNFDKVEMMEELQKEVNKLMGFEIIEQGKNYCILKNVAQAMESEFDGILQRNFLMLKSGFNELSESVKNGKVKKEDYVNLELINNKLSNFCQRVLNKMGHHDIHKTTGVYYVVCQLEHIADELRDMSGILAVKKNTDNIVHLISQINDLFNLLYTTFYKYRIENLLKMKKLEHEIMDESKRRIEEDPLVVHHIMNITKKIHHMTDYIN